MAVQTKYTFLELLREADAIARGANLTDKINHAVFRAIKQASSSDVAKQGGLFTLSTNIPEILNLTKKDLTQVVQRLIADKLVGQIFRLEYDKSTGAIKVVPCFLCHGMNDRESPLQIYGDVNEHTMRSLEACLDARPPFDEKIFRADLEFDLSSDKIPEVKSLPNTLIDLFSGIHASKFDIIPPADLISGTVKELEEELVFRGKVARIVDYGLLPVREVEIVDRFEAAADFFLGRILEKYVSRGSIKRELEPIAADEAAYHTDPHAAPTVDFTIRRAQALKKTVLATPTRGQGARYPGALCVEILLQLEVKTRVKYQDKWRADQNQQHQDFKRRLLHSATWIDAITFIPEAKSHDMAPEAWKRITTDKELIHRRWEEPTSTIHVFVRNDQSAFRILVRGMADLPATSHWQILAMKSILEAHEDRYRELFDDAEFVRQYGILLRMAYMDYIPWIFRILHQLGFKFFQDKSFRIAKAKIGHEQEMRAQKNNEKAASLRAAREEERKAAVEHAQTTAMSSAVLAVLDRLYLQENRIPTVAEVRAACAEVPPESFLELLKAEKFQLPGAGAILDEAILLYPMNHEWRSRVARLRRVFDRIEQGKGRDPEMENRLKKIRKFMSRIERGGAASQTGEEDPYEKFGREMKRYNQREAGAQAPDDDELDV